MPRKHMTGLGCKHGPENMFKLSSPIGVLELVCCPRGIHNLQLSGWKGDEDFNPDVRQQVKIKSQLYEDNGYTYKSALICVEWLQSYFHNLCAIDTVKKPLLCHLDRHPSHVSVSFTEKVWSTLERDVGSGRMVSYAQLAVMSGGTSKFSRAVGTAMKNNPVMIIVPCHRVIRSNGAMGNYSGGTKNSVKTWLLQHEGALE